MDERIKKLRKALNMTQEEFSKRIGIKRNTLANYEIGRNEPIDGIIFSICREFNVNEKWLRNGDGDMFTAVPAEELDRLAERYKLSVSAKRFVKAFVELDEKEMQVVLDFMAKVVAVDDEMAATIDPAAEQSNPNQWAAEINKAQSILDAQKVIDIDYNNNGAKKRQLSS